MSRQLRSIFFLALCTLAPKAAFAACSSAMPYVFNPASYVSSATTNANNNFLLSCVRTVDNTQVGTAGIFASQIKPTSGPQATFGGTQIYTFPSAGLLTTGPISATSYLAGTSGTETIAGAFRYGINSGGYTSAVIASNNGSAPGGVASSAYGLFTNTGVNLHSVNTAGDAYYIGTLGAANIQTPGNVTVGGAVNVTGNYNSVGGSVNAASMVSSGLSTFQAATVNGALTGFTGGTASQFLPVIVGGSAITGQANAHVEYVRVNNTGGTNVYSFTKPFDATPICVGSYDGVTTPTVPLAFEAISTTQYRVTTGITVFVTGICAGA